MNLIKMTQGGFSFSIFHLLDPCILWYLWRNKIDGKSSFEDWNSVLALVSVVWVNGTFEQQIGFQAIHAGLLGTGSLHKMWIQPEYSTAFLYCETNPSANPFSTAYPGLGCGGGALKTEVPRPPFPSAPVVLRCFVSCLASPRGWICRKTPHLGVIEDTDAHTTSPQLLTLSLKMSQDDLQGNIYDCLFFQSLQLMATGVGGSGDLPVNQQLWINTRLFTSKGSLSIDFTRDVALNHLLIRKRSTLLTPPLADKIPSYLHFSTWGMKSWWHQYLMMHLLCKEQQHLVGISLYKYIMKHFSNSGSKRPCLILNV